MILIFGLIKKVHRVGELTNQQLFLNDGTQTDKLNSPAFLWESIQDSDKISKMLKVWYRFLANIEINIEQSLADVK